MRMLVVESERALATLFKRYFEAAGREVEVAADSDGALAMLAEFAYDLLLLDLNVQVIEQEATELLRAARQARDRMPILVVGGVGSVEERLKCFELGADDCVPKPFALRELNARVQALYRRAQATSEPVLRCADLELNPRRRSAERNGRNIELSAREYALIEYLVQHKGRCVPRSTLLKQVWDMPEQSGTNVVEVYVNYIRRKIDQGFAQPLIHTVRGQGYVMREVHMASPVAISEDAEPARQPRKTPGSAVYNLASPGVA